MSAAAKRRSGDAAAEARARLHREAELIRLGRVLGVEPAELEFLEGADETALRELRIMIADHLYERAVAGLRNAAKLAGLLPGPISAKLSQHALGPVLSAWTLPLLDPALVSSIGDRMPATFLADTAVHLDLRRAAPVIGSIPEEKLRAAGAMLADREEYVVLAAFVGYLELDVLDGLLEIFTSETLLQAAFLIEEPDRIDALVAHMPDDRIDDLHLAARRAGLWEQSLALLASLGPEQQQRFADSLARLDAEHHAVLGEQLRADPTLLAIAQPLLARLDAGTRDAVGAS